MQPHNNRAYQQAQQTHPANANAAQMYANQQQQHHLQQAQQQPQYPVAPRKPHNMAAQYPVHPDVKFKRLPFYDVVCELIKPSSLVRKGPMLKQDSTFQFRLTTTQADMIGTSRSATLGNRYEFTTQVILRFCLLETASEQEDCFPPLFTVKVNENIVPLPNPIPPKEPWLEPKRPPQPVNITGLVKISPLVSNLIQCTWRRDKTCSYVMVVLLVKKRTSHDLLLRLIDKRACSADFTQRMIIDKLKEDDEIAATSLRVPLLCPLGKMRIVTPCRAFTCDHIQCFDALTYLAMNEKKSSWICPVCNKQAIYDKLVIDGYFQEVLRSPSLSSDCTDLELQSDGSWKAVVNNKMELIDYETPKKSGPVKMESASTVAVEDIAIITSSDSDDVDDDAPLKPKKTKSNNAGDFAPSYQESQKTVVAAASPRQPLSPGLIILDDSP